MLDTSDQALKPRFQVSSYRWGIAAIFIAVGICVVAISFLAASVRKEVDDLASANSDTTQWSLSQTEVDLLALRLAAAETVAAEENASLRNLRRRFDIFYSRVNTLTEGSQYERLRTLTGNGQNMEAMTSFLDRNVSSFDGSDEDLRAALPRIIAELEDLHDNVRAFSLFGVSEFASVSDEQRDSVAALLARIGFLTFALVLTLILFVLVLLALIRRSVKTERAVLEARNRLQQVISASIDAILVVGQDGRIIDYNGAAEGIFGHKREDVIGQDMAEIVIPDHLREAHSAGMTRYRKTGEKRVVGSGLVKLEAKRKDGSVFPADVIISAVESARGEIFISHIRDISDQVAAEKELIEARDKAVAGEKAKAALLAVMSHEMRTPLNGLLGTMQLMQDTDLEASQKRYLSAMETSANLLLHHVNGVLSISSAESGQLTLTNTEIQPAALLEELVESQRHAIEANGNRISFHVHGDTPKFWADRLRVNQVILNLVGNANKFTRDGEIIVEFDNVPDRNMVEFRVIDTGMGISEENQQRIFEEFQTVDSSYGRAAEGTGLGLSISKRLVEAMGGEIGVESEPGEGSLFWVRLPVGRAVSEIVQPAPRRERAMPRGEPVKSLNVLLVEDNKINRLVAREMLEKDSHSVVEAHDGSEGIARADETKYDVIFMDISMPVVDGITATRTIRSGDGPNRDTPIIALTAHALQEDLERFHEAGVTNVLVKPLSRDGLKQVLFESDHAAEPSEDSQGLSAISDLVDSLGSDSALDLLNTFLEEIEEMAVSLSRKGDNPDAWSDLAAQSHKCAGSAAVFQTLSLADSLRKLETAFKAGDGDRIREGRDQFETAWTETRRSLEDARKSFGKRQVV